jgi:hypothetical protein
MDESGIFVDRRRQLLKQVARPYSKESRPVAGVIAEGPHPLVQTNMMRDKPARCLSIITQVYPIVNVSVFFKFMDFSHPFRPAVWLLFRI